LRTGSLVEAPMMISVDIADIVIASALVIPMFACRWTRD